MLTDSSSSIILLRSYSAQAGSNMADAIVAISNNKRKWFSCKSLSAWSLKKKNIDEVWLEELSYSKTTKM